MSALIADADDAEIDPEQVRAFVADVGRRVRYVRQQKAISRRELSERSGVSQRYLANLEGGTGNISIALLYQVATALDTMPDAFVGKDDPWMSDTQRLLQLFRQADDAQRARALEELQGTSGSPNKARRICLIGLRGAGKSTLGALLAERLKTDFVELNRIIEAESGIPIAEVMALYGNEGYRQLEQDALETVFNRHESVVLAVGGGIVSQPATYATLRRMFHTIWLKALPEEHMERVREQGDRRPMAGNPRAMEELRSILRSREALYARADRMVDTSHQSVSEALERLVEVAAKLHSS